MVGRGFFHLASGLIIFSGLASEETHAEDAPPLVRALQVVVRDSGSGQLMPIELYGKMLGLVIGIDQYADPGYNLKYAKRDAEAVARALKDEFAFAQVVELYNDQATRAAIVRQITELAHEAGDNDAVLLFFAGHGTEVGKDENAVGYLIPHDGGFREEKAEWANNVSMNTIIHDWSRRIGAKHIFYVMDACYSGLMATRTKSGRVPKRDLAYLKEMTREPVRIVLTAGTKGQQVLDGGNKEGHSVFTARLLESLRQHRDFVTAMELAAGIKRKVAADASARGHTQTPDYARLVGLGDFVFIPKEDSPEALQAKLKEIEAALAKMTEVQKAAARKAKAELEARLVAARKREELRKLAELDATAQAEAAALRRVQAAEMQRKLSEAWAREAAARAKFMTIAAAMSEAENILDRMAQTAASVDADFAPLVKKLGAPKDMFEKTAAYQARQAKLRKLTGQDIPEEKKRRLKGFIEALQIMNGKEFLVDRAEVKVDLKSYDADQEVFDIEYRRGEGKPTKLCLVMPPKEARDLYTAWKDQTLVSRSYALLEVEQRGEEVHGVKEELSRLEFVVPGREDAYVLHTSFVLVVESDPPGAAVEVRPQPPAAGRGPAVTPCRIQVERAGTYTVALSLKGHRAVSREVTLRGSGLLPVRVTLERSSLPPGLEDAFDIPPQGKDSCGNPVRQGFDEKTGWPLEIRHKATGMHLAFISPGSFERGSNNGDSDEKPVHAVTLTKSFYIGKYEVTQAEWQKVMGANPSQFKGDRNPAEQVSWNECHELLKKLNEGVSSARFSASLPDRAKATTTSLRFALPTEAEWEYACRAGTKTEFCFGDKERTLGDYAWYSSNSDRKTHPVGEKKPNPWGLYDMHGNVWEWCEDWHGDYSRGEVTDPSGPRNGSDRVIRGGSWYFGARPCRSAYRSGFSPDSRYSYLGCRVSLRSNP